MPNRENVKKWVDALRSGDYKQGTGYLNKDGEFCCLGVACDLAEKDGVNLSRAQRVDDGAYTYEGRHGYPPASVAEWLGLATVESGNGLADELDIQIMTTDEDKEEWPVRATEANDDLHWDFGQIADAIEKTYLTPVAA